MHSSLRGPNLVALGGGDHGEQVGHASPSRKQFLSEKVVTVLLRGATTNQQRAEEERVRDCCRSKHHSLVVCPSPLVWRFFLCFQAWRRNNKPSANCPATSCSFGRPQTNYLENPHPAPSSSFTEASCGSGRRHLPAWCFHILPRFLPVPVTSCRSLPRELRH